MSDRQLLLVQDSGPTKKKFWVERLYAKDPTIAETEEFFDDARASSAPGSARYSTFRTLQPSMMRDDESSLSAEKSAERLEKWRKENPKRYGLRLEWFVYLDVSLDE